jgi:C-terminal processing protease CtpA/Prc
MGGSDLVVLLFVRMGTYNCIADFYYGLCIETHIAERVTLKASPPKSIVLFIIVFTLSACNGLFPRPVNDEVANPILSAAQTINSPSPEYNLLTPADMRGDLDELFSQVEKVHPNLYAKRSKEDVDRDRQTLYAELSQPMSVVDFYKKVAPLIASLGDDHTRVLPPRDIFDEIYDHEKLFPLALAFEGGQAFIVSNPAGNADIPLGAVLLEINGAKVSDVLPNLIPDPRLPFAWKLWLFYGSNPEYRLTILSPGQTIPVSLVVPGLTLAEMEKQSAVAETWEEVSYRTLPQKQTGLLTVNSFTNIKEPLKQAFRQIQKDHVNRLIIDIRANDGGYLESLQFLMDYLTEGPYQKCYQCAWIKPADVADRYHGQLYLLIGPDTMSTAVTFATILQDQGLATLIGEETLEPSSFCANIIPDGDTLTRTGLRYTVSYTCYIRPSGIADGHGVVPDIIVKTTVQDKINHNNRVLEHTLKAIQNGG